MTREQALEHFRSMHGDSFKEDELVETADGGWMDAQTGELAPKTGETEMINKIVEADHEADLRTTRAAINTASEMMMKKENAMTTYKTTAEARAAVMNYLATLDIEGVEGRHYELFEHGTADEYGVAYFLVTMSPNGESLPARPDSELYRSYGREFCPHCGVHLSNGCSHHGDEVNGKPLVHDTHEFCCLACNGEFGNKLHKVSDKTKAAISASWADEAVKEARTTRHAIEVVDTEGQKAIYPSMRRAFDALKLPMGRHIAFRATVKKAAPEPVAEFGMQFRAIPFKKES